MEKEPLLPYSTSPSPTRLRNFQSLFSLPEDDEISVSLPLTPTELKNHLIFGPSTSKDQNFTNSIPNTPPSFESFVNSNPYIDSPHNLTQPQIQIQHNNNINNNNNNNNSSSSPSSSSSSSWLLDPNFQWICKTSLHRSKTAPAMAVINDLKKNSRDDPSNPKPNFAMSQPIIRQAFVLLVLYLLFGVVIYWFNRRDFLASETHPVVDALYFCIVTMCTIGYGDITPNTTATKLFSILFVLVGFGFIDILLTGMVSYVLDLQESYLLRAVKGNGGGGGEKKKDSPGFFLIDVKKGRMRIRMKVALALGVVVLCIGIGAMVMHFVEQLGWMDSLYLSVMSVTTVGYGDRAFRSLPGRIFASIWLLVSTLAVARAFLYLAEARVDKRQRRMVKWVLGQDMTVAEFLAADIDNNGFVSKSEYVIYKLKEMGKVSDKDIMQICQKFDRLDTGNCGKITLVDLMESHQT